MRRKLFLVLDVEGAGELDCAFVYDIGGLVVDKKGKIYDSFSFLVSEIFNDEPLLMKSAYYAEKLPKYYEGLLQGKFVFSNFYNLREHVKTLLAKYKIDEVMAYNARYDTMALNNTQRWLTKSKFRYFLPYGVKVSCIWHMACQVICTQKSYRAFCLMNGYVSDKGNLKTSAEVVYSYLIDQNFVEEHSGLEDVKIEVAIMARCFRQHKKMSRGMNRACWRIPQKRKGE